MLQCALVDLNIFSKLISVSQRLWSNIGMVASSAPVKCRKMQRNGEKCKEMQRNAERCREMQRDAEKFREM